MNTILDLNLLTLLTVLGDFDFSHLFMYNDAVQNIIGGLKKLSNALKLIGIALGAIGVAMSGYQFIWGGANGSQQGKQYLLNTAIGVVLIVAATSIIDWITTNVTF